MLSSKPPFALLSFSRNSSILEFEERVTVSTKTIIRFFYWEGLVELDSRRLPTISLFCSSMTNFNSSSITCATALNAFLVCECALKLAESFSSPLFNMSLVSHSKLCTVSRHSFCFSRSYLYIKSLEDIRTLACILLCTVKEWWSLQS